jgi:RHS repeat-associated protein
VSSPHWSLRNGRIVFVAAVLLSVGAPSGLAGQQFIYVYPDGGQATKPFNTNQSAGFGVVGLVNGQGYYREILCTGQVTDCSSPTPQYFTAPLPGSGMTVNYRTMSAGTGRIRLKVYAPSGTPKDTGWFNVTVEAVSGNIDVTNNDNQDVALCASSCFGVIHTQSTVPYYSLGAPRHVTLVYHGDRSSLVPFVHADVAPAAGTPTPSEYWLEAKINNAFVPFLNEGGGTRIRFHASSQQVRLAGQFNASGYATGAHPMDIIVTSKYWDGSTQQKVFATRLLNVDERQSRIARGWSIAGLQRIYVQGDGSLLITGGDGSAAYFAYNSGCGCYTSPSGDFSTVRWTGSAYERAYPDSTKATFNTAGQLTRIADRFGNSTDFEYDGSGRLTKIYDPFRTYNGGANRSYIALSYGTYGISQIQEPGPDGSPSGGRATYVTVASDSTLRVFRDPDGDSTVFGYDAGNGLRLQTVTNRRGGITTYNYDALGKLASVDLPTVTLWDGSSARPRTSYSPWQTVSVPTGSTATYPFQPTWTADVRGRMTDPLGRQSTFTNDHWGQPLQITDPVGRTTIITRNGVNPSSVQRPTGAIDNFGFNGALLTAFRPAGETWVNIDYGAWAEPTLVAGTDRVTLQRFLGPNGRVDSTRIASSVTKYFYDTRGRVDSVVDPGGHVTKHHYDPLFGNLDSTLAPGGRFTKATFDGYGRLQTQRANDEPTRTVVYDAINRVREVYDGVNPSPTRYIYDQLYLTSVEDPKAQLFRFETNALGWVTREYDPADPFNRYDSFGYDSAGNVRTWTNRRGQQVSYTYDQLNRPTSKSGTNTTTDSIAYSFDGLKVVAWNSVSRDSVFFRSNGWVDSVATRIGGRRFRTFYRPTSVNRLDAVEFVNDAGIAFANRRFGWNLQTGALDTALVNSQVTRFARNNEFLPTQTLWPSLTRTHQWTAVHRPGELSFSDPTVNASLFRGFSYDGRFNLRDRIQWEGANFRTKQAGYDGLRRLGNQGNNLYATSSCPWDVASGYLCPLVFQQTLTYDPGGNRTDVANAAYTTGNRVLSFGVYTFTHDLDGNIVEKYNTSTGERKRFEWSAEGRLTRVLVNDIERVRYEYNVAGLLVRRWTNGSLDRHFLWDQGHLLAELDGTATQRVGEYAYLPGADQPLALITGAQSIAAIRYAVQDEVGNVVGLLNGVTIDQQVAYDDWGVPTVTGSADNRLLFKGLLWESNYTGMYYMRARWYDPELGRFISEDPQGISEGTNYYAFAGGDPLNLSDPTGEFIGGFFGTLFGGAIIGAVAGVVTKAVGNIIKKRPVFRGWEKAALGGAVAGAVTAVVATYVLPQFLPATGGACRGGFTGSECGVIRDALDFLIGSPLSGCSLLGRSAAARFSFGGLLSGFIRGRTFGSLGAAWWPTGRTSLDPSILKTAGPGSDLAATVIAHEERHHLSWFSGHSKMFAADLCGRGFRPS